MDESKIILLILIAGNLCVVIAMLYLFLARVERKLDAAIYRGSFLRLEQTLRMRDRAINDKNDEKVKLIDKVIEKELVLITGKEDLFNERKTALQVIEKIIKDYEQRD